MSSEEILFVTEIEAGERLDKILAQRFSAIQSRTYFQMLIDDGRVLVNGDPVKKRTKLQVGDEIQVQFILTPEIGLEPEAIPLDIIYEDEHLIAVNKAVGMVVHPATGNWTGTFVNALLYHCKQLPTDDSLRPGIVHRLDKDTSGILLAAKTTTAQQRLITLFAGRQVYKEYLAICLGNPGTIILSGAIGRHPVDRKRMAVTENGKPAITHCTSLVTKGNLSLLRVVLETGRTHQIRVHLQHRGTPILGDAIYGNSSANAKYGATRQLLHASLIKLSHPITGAALELHAPIPADMQTWIDKLQHK